MEAPWEKYTNFHAGPALSQGFPPADQSSFIILNGGKGDGRRILWGTPRILWSPLLHLSATRLEGPSQTDRQGDFQCRCGGFSAGLGFDCGPGGFQCGPGAVKCGRQIGSNILPSSVGGSGVFKAGEPAPPAPVPRHAKSFKNL